MRFKRAISRGIVSIGLVWAVASPLALEAQEKAVAPGAEGQPSLPKAEIVPSQDELNRRFEELLDNSQLVGFFTESGKETETPLHADKYTIENVKKLKDDYWLFEARIQYNNQDTKMPLPVEVKWAGDTPVITLTKVFVPGLGTFTARVLFYGDEYAGTWSAGDHGGHMFGRVVKAEAGDAQATAE
jgi:hypothetical protein